jgi:hypothetical protein
VGILAVGVGYGSIARLMAAVAVVVAVAAVGRRVAAA